MGFKSNLNRLKQYPPIWSSIFAGLILLAVQTIEKFFPNVSGWILLVIVFSMFMPVAWVTLTWVFTDEKARRAAESRRLAASGAPIRQRHIMERFAKKGWNFVPFKPAVGVIVWLTPAIVAGVQWFLESRQPS